MLTRSGLRSSALARAEAQLAGQRVPVKPKDSADELQEYMHALNKKTNALKLSQPMTVDLSDLSGSEQDSEKHKGPVSSPQLTGTGSRFLKKKSDKDGQPMKEVSKPSHPPPVQSQAPTSAALRRLAEFENRHRIRKLEIDLSENDSDLRTSEERPFSNRSSSDFSTRGNRFLKKKVNIVEPKLVEQSRSPEIRGNSTRRVVESEEEEIRHLVGSSLEFSENDNWWQIPKPPRTPSPPSKSTPRRNLHRSPSALGFISPRRPPSRFLSRTPSPPSHGTPRFSRRTHSLNRFGSSSPSPSVRSSLTNSSPRARLERRSKTPLSQRSDLKSLDELFSRADDVSSASSIDFKLNILSLDELAPVDQDESADKTVYEKPKTTKQPSATPHEELSPNNEKALGRQTSSSDDESAPEVHTESEVSQHGHKQHSTSSEDYLQKQPDESTAYSEDFEESVPYDTSEGSKFDSYSSKSISSDESSLSPRHSYQPPGKLTEKKHHRVQRVLVRETSVQTNDAEMTFHWPQATIGLVNATTITVEPSSVLRHMVSPEVIDALTTYSPMALALNDMLKQQLLLTQTFVDMTQQLYLSTIRSLESETYQYTTLEDTKKYIKQQKYRKWKRTQSGEISGTHSSKVQKR
ncbi:uncharacterized protein C19orf44 homolog [Gastrophryne carolinensis]